MKGVNYGKKNKMSFSNMENLFEWHLKGALANTCFSFYYKLHGKYLWNKKKKKKEPTWSKRLSPELNMFHF